MMLVNGVWLPDGERHLIRYVRDGETWEDGRGAYQLHKLRPAVALCPPERRRVAVDVGAHVGLWSRPLSHLFQEVHAFEPVPDFQECWRANMSEAENATLYEVALGKERGVVSLHYKHGHSGSTHIAEGGNVTAPIERLDAFALGNVDFMKIDCEGWEENVLHGAAATVAACQPVVVVEQKPGFAESRGFQRIGAVRLLEAWGYRVWIDMGGDFICIPRGHPEWERRWAPYAP